MYRLSLNVTVSSSTSADVILAGAVLTIGRDGNAEVLRGFSPDEFGPGISGAATMPGPLLCLGRYHAGERIGYQGRTSWRMKAM